MKKYKQLVLLIFLIFALVGCSKDIEYFKLDGSEFVSNDEEISVLDAVYGDGFTYVIYITSEDNYKLAKYDMKGNKKESLDLVIDSPDAFKPFKLFYTNDVLSLVYSNLEDITITTLIFNDNLEITNNLVITNEKLSLQRYIAKNFIVVDDTVYLIKTGTVNKYSFENNEITFENSMEFESINLVESVYNNEFYIVADINENEFVIDGSTYQSTSNQVLLKLSNNFEYLNHISIPEGIEVEGIKITDTVYIYGLDNANCYIAKYNKDLTLDDEIELNLVTELYIHGVVGVQEYDNEVRAIIQNHNDFVGVFTIDFDSDEYKLLYTDESDYSVTGNNSEVIGVFDDLFIISKTSDIKVIIK